MTIPLPIVEPSTSRTTSPNVMGVVGSSSLGSLPTSSNNTPGGLSSTIEQFPSQQHGAGDTSTVASQVTPQASNLGQQQQSSSSLRKEKQRSVIVQRKKMKQYAVSTQWERQVLEERGRQPVKDFHHHFCCCATRIGNMFALVSYSDGTPLVLAGPCWPFCVCFTLPLIVGVSFLVIYYLIISDRFTVPSWILYIYVPTVIFVLIALFCVSCRDPGLMERVTDEEAGEGGWFWNEQVGSYRPPGALYCRECGVLIQDYDHLCPWTGTGIGRKNMWAFKTFVVSINILCYLSLGILVWALLDGLAA